MKSPCVSICMMDPSADICMGCCRTLDEIADWHKYTDEQREQVMSQLKSREQFLWESKEQQTAG